MRKELKTEKLNYARSLHKHSQIVHKIAKHVAEYVEKKCLLDLALAECKEASEIQTHKLPEDHADRILTLKTLNKIQATIDSMSVSHMSTFTRKRARTVEPSGPTMSQS